MPPVKHSQRKSSTVEVTHKVAKRKTIKKKTLASAVPSDSLVASKQAIDDLFNTAQKKVQKQRPNHDTIPHNTQGSKCSSQVQPEAQQDKPFVGNKHDLFGHEAAVARRRTEEGYNIYTEDELGLNAAGGNTPQCPFDCQCCY